MISRIIRQLAFTMAFMACFSLYVQDLAAQNVQTTIDRKDILIGEHINYAIKFTLPSAQYQVDFNIPDSIPHFDIINKLKSDSVDDQGNYLVMQKILLTSFDSGKWNLPSFAVKIRASATATVYTLNTDLIPINVGYAPADSSGQLRDIKPVMDVFVIDNNWIYAAIAALLLIVLAIILYRYFKKRKKDKPLFESPLGAYEEAMKSLKNLQGYNTGNAESLRAYYTGLVDTFKKYYSRKEQVNLLNETTGDILLRLKVAGADTAILFTLAEALRISDAVKFAKFLPPQYESEKSMSQVKEVIELIEKQVKK